MENPNVIPLSRHWNKANFKKEKADILKHDMSVFLLYINKKVQLNEKTLDNIDIRQRGAVLTSYRLWLHMSERALTEGGKCVNAKWYSRLQYGLCAGALILAGIYFTTRANSPRLGNLAYSPVYVSVLILIVALVDLFVNYLKSKGASKTTNVICYLMWERRFRWEIITIIAAAQGVTIATAAVIIIA